LLTKQNGGLESTSYQIIDNCSKNYSLIKIRCYNSPRCSLTSDRIW